MRALFDRDSALYFKPAYWPRLAPWLLRFWTYCNERDHAHGTAAIARSATTSSTWSRRCGPTASSSSSTSRAWCSPPAAPTTRAPSCASCQPMRELRLRAARRHHHRRRAARARAGAVAEGDAPGFLIHQHWHVRPDSFTAGLADVLRRDGVEIREGAEVFELVQQGNRADARCAPPPATSTPTPSCSRPGRGRRRSRARSASRCRWRPGKGYSFYVRPTVVPSHAILLADVHVGCTPYGDRMRIGGTMEFSGINTRLDRRRIDAIVAGAQESFLPWQTPDIEAEWAGMRPITADGLPILDRAGALDNIYVATGLRDAGRHAGAAVRARRWPR